MKLFTVGPVEMYPYTLDESAIQLPYFRTSEFSEIMLESEQLLLNLTFAPEGSRAVFLTASGTGAMEAVVMNCLCQADNVMVIDGGSFGHRFANLCDIHSIKKNIVNVPFGVTLTEKMLDDLYSEDMTALLVNIHETSVGQLYDLKMIGDFCHKHKMLLIVDAISSFIADELDMQVNGVDVLILSSQKAFALAPGISLVVLSPNGLQAIEKNNAGCAYFDFKDYLKNGERGQTPYTPAVGILLTLNTRLKKLYEQGITNARKEILQLAYDFRERCASLPIIIPSYPHSNALTPIYFPNSNAKEVYTILRNKYDITVTPNGGDLCNKLLRVGHMGNLTTEDNTALIDAMKMIL